MSYSCRKSDLKYSRYSKTLKMLNLYSHFPAHEEQPHFEPGHGGACPQFHKSCRLSLWCDASPVNSCPSPLRPPSSCCQIEHAHTCHRSFSHGQWSAKKRSRVYYRWSPDLPWRSQDDSIPSLSRRQAALVWPSVILFGEEKCPRAKSPSWSRAAWTSWEN